LGLSASGTKVDKVKTRFTLLDSGRDGFNVVTSDTAGAFKLIQIVGKTYEAQVYFMAKVAYSCDEDCCAVA
jgi:hypothetical protein